jgi:hypothetical protein
MRIATIIGVALIAIPACNVSDAHAQESRWTTTLNDQVAAGVERFKSLAPAGTDFTSDEGFIALRSKRVFGTGLDLAGGAQTGKLIDPPFTNRFTKPHEPTIPMLKLEWKR